MQAYLNKPPRDRESEIFLRLRRFSASRNGDDRTMMRTFSPYSPSVAHERWRPYARVRPPPARARHPVARVPVAPRGYDYVLVKRGGRWVVVRSDPVSVS